MNSKNFYRVILFCILGSTLGLHAGDSFSDVVNESLERVDEAFQIICNCVSTGKSKTDKVALVQTEAELISEYLESKIPDIFFVVDALTIALSICPNHTHKTFDNEYAEIRKIIIDLLACCIKRAYKTNRINLPDPNGDTIFHKIMAKSQYLSGAELEELVSYLVFHHADERQTNNAHKCPVDIVPEKQKAKIMQLIQQQKDKMQARL